MKSRTQTRTQDAAAIRLNALKATEAYSRGLQAARATARTCAAENARLAPEAAVERMMALGGWSKVISTAFQIEVGEATSPGAHGTTLRVADFLFTEDLAKIRVEAQTLQQSLIEGAK